MRMSLLIGKRYKERPAEAALESHSFLLRGGYARQVANGIYSLLPPGVRVIQNIETILREEMNRVGGQEVLMPIAQPRELWDESGRYTSVGSELLRFVDRTGHEMVLAMTHEEGVVHLCRNELDSHTQLPFMVYQIQTKFRDEPRSRGGLIRVREFTMKDGYSFHASQKDLENYYRQCYRAYQRIFARVGLPEVIAVESDTGMMGGKVAHEFILLTDVGEDTIVVCERSDYIANMEVATGHVAGFPAEPKPLGKILTPGEKTIEEVAAFLGVKTRQTAKAVFFENDVDGKVVLVVVRGDREVNEMKLAKLIGAQPVPATDARIRSVGAEPGFASPMGIDRSKCRLIVDHTVRTSNNLVAGANETDYHYVNFNLERDAPGVETVDVIQVMDGDSCPHCDSGALQLRRGIEVGNIFQLGTKYTTTMKMIYNDEQGNPAVPIMGCYGIGVGRLMSSIMEARRDKFGPIWPITVSPWQVHLCALKLNEEKIRKTSDELLASLERASLEVLFDDRDARAGVQFADADLLGIPFRLIVSERNVDQSVVEWKRRDTGESGTLPLSSAVETIRGWVEDAHANIEQSTNAIGRL